jgi:hypothetical protein
MATTNLNNDELVIDTGLDSIVIIKCLETIPGGRSLNVTDFTPNVIQKGHIVIKNNSNDEYKPMPITSAGDEYDSLPANHTIVGVLNASILTRKPMAAIMVRGSVNMAASPYPVTSGIISALPLIRFTKD